MHEKRKILILRILSVIIFLLSLGLFITNIFVPFNSKIIESIMYISLVGSFAWIIALIRVKVKKYEYNGQSFIIYAGAFIRYLKKDDEIVAKDDSHLRIVPVHLTYQLEENKTLVVTVYGSNRIDIDIIEGEYQIINVNNTKKLKK